MHGPIVAQTYLAAVAAFYGVLAIEALVWVPIIHKAQATHSIPVVTAFIGLALAYLPMALRARLLGGIVEPHLTSLRG